MLISGSLLSIGLTIALARSEVRPEGPPPEMLDTIALALSGRGDALLRCGLVLLMLTPVARVAVLMAGWFLQGDRRYALVSLVVLTLLSISIALGSG